jgi:hypothetical protein
LHRFCIKKNQTCKLNETDDSSDVSGVKDKVNKTGDDVTIYTEEQVMILEKGQISCDEFEAQLCDYADGELPKTMKAMMEAHECSCEECAESKRTYLLTIRLARTLRCDVSISSEIENRLREKLNERLGLTLKPINISMN